MKYVINDTTLSNIADAIRTKDGTSATMLVSDMASKILAIPSGSGSLPSSIHTGTFTPSTDEETEFVISHNCNGIPSAFVIIADEVENILADRITYSIISMQSWNSYYGVWDNNRNLTAKTAGAIYVTIAKDSTNITISRSGGSYRFRAGYTYRWFAWESEE